jgi:DNA-binding IclR family transcriptional regulator
MLDKPPPRTASPRKAADTARQDGAAQPGDNAPRGRTSGIDRMLQILDLLRDRAEPMTGYELARGIGAPISTIYAVTEELVARDMLSRDADGRLWLGARLHHYGLAYARNLDVMALANHEMNRLSADVAECVQICGRDGDQMVVLAMAEGPGHFNVSSRVGTRVPLNWTASGRLLVGHLPLKDCVAFFKAHAQPSPTGRAVTDAGELAHAVREAFAQRLAMQIGESDFSVACIAAPILDASGTCAYTISIVLPEFRAREDLPRYVAAVQAAARRIEEGLGWRAHQSG